MAVGGWVCLLAPLVGFLAILLAGTRITRRQAGLISTRLGLRRLRGRGLCVRRRRSAASPDDRVELTTAWTWFKAGDFEVGPRAPRSTRSRS